MEPKSETIVWSCVHRSRIWGLEMKELSGSGSDYDPLRRSRAAAAWEWPSKQGLQSFRNGGESANPANCLSWQRGVSQGKGHLKWVVEEEKMNVSCSFEIRWSHRGCSSFYQHFSPNFPQETGITGIRVKLFPDGEKSLKKPVVVNPH